jgi:hypothetical protein
LPEGVKWWRPALALVAFALWAPLAYVALPLAGLLWLGGPKGLTRGALAGGLTALSVWWLLAPGDAIAQLHRSWIVSFTLVLLTAAWWRRGAYLPRAGVAIVGAALISGALLLLFGPSWAEVTWLVSREAGIVWRRVAAFAAPDAAPLFATLGERVAAATAATFPAIVALQALAAGAIAWQLTARLEPRGPVPALARFRDFDFSDHLIWSMVFFLVAVLLPVATWIKATALNLGVVAGVLYVLRGLAVAAVALDAGGVSVAVIVVLAVLSVVLALPLLVIVPGLWVIGISDTWLDFRRRLAGARSTS